MTPGDTLQLLLDQGAALVRALVADPDTKPADKAEPFERYARALRRTVALIDHRATEAAASRDARTLARARIVRDVDDAIDRLVPHPDRAESLRAELRERLDDPALDLEIRNKPVEHAIRDIKRDLGLERMPGVRPSPRRTPAAIRAITALATAPTGGACGLALPERTPLDPTPEPRPPKPGDHHAPPPTDRSLLEYLLTKHPD